MKPIIVLFSFILLFSCENKKEMKHEQEPTKSINRDTSNVSDLNNDKTQTENSSNRCYYDKLSNQLQNHPDYQS